MAKGLAINDAGLTDAAGVTHPVAAEDARIVSLVPSITELLFDLGLAYQVVGRTKYCIHPKDAVSGIPIVGGTKRLDLQALYRCRPTYVIVNVDENTLEMADQVQRLGVSMVVTHPLAPEDNLALYRLLGGIFGAKAAAEDLTRAFNDALRRLLKLAQTLPHRKILYLIWRKPWMTISHATYIARTLRLVNWTTLATGEPARYPVLEDPCELLDQADLVLLSSEPFPFAHRHIDELRTRCPDTQAQFALIDAEMVSWYGSRAIRGLDYLRKYSFSLQS